MRESLLEDLVTWSLLLCPACHHGERKKLLIERGEKKGLVVMDVARYDIVLIYDTMLCAPTL